MSNQDLRRIDDPTLDRVDDLPVDPIINHRTDEEGQCMGFRSWKRGDRQVRMIDVRIDNGGSYTFKTWTAANCSVLIGKRVLAAR